MLTSSRRSARPAPAPGGRRWLTASVALDRRLAELVPAGARPSGSGAVAVDSCAGPATHVAVGLVRRLLAPRRVRAYERELPAALESVAAQLRAGASLTQAVVAAAPSPSGRSDLAEHWGRLARLAPVGGIDAAVADWVGAADAVPSVRLAASALALAAATGGSAARAIDGVASTLRSRLAMADEVRALASQARASAVVIALAPVVFGALAGLTDRRILEFFLSPAGGVVLLLGIGLDAVGAWWMHRLCRVPA